jgi:hypothetical protein
MENANKEKDMIDRLTDNPKIRQLTISELALVSDISRLMGLKIYQGFFVKYCIKTYSDKTLTIKQKQIILATDVLTFIQDNWGKAHNEIVKLISLHKEKPIEEVEKFTIDDLITYVFELIEAITPIRLLKKLGMNIDDIKGLFKFSDKDLESVKSLIKK